MISTKTIIIDIDGTLVKHKGSLSKVTKDYNPEEKALEGVVEKIDEWESEGYNIILISGRKESSRRFTEKQLEKMGVFYDQLILGVGGGARYLVNDRKPDGTLTAYAYNVERNKGLKDLSI